MRFIYGILCAAVAAVLLSGYFIFQGHSPMSNLYNTFQFVLKIQGVNHRIVRSEKYRIPVYETRNHCGKKLILLHGFGSDATATWLKILPGLKNDYHVIAPQMIYASYSQVNRQSYQLTEEVKMVHELVKTSGIKEFHLIGYSLGGWVAIKYTHDHPEMVKSLILIDPVSIKINIPEFVYTIPSDRQTAKQFLDSLFYDPPYIPGFMLDIFIRACQKNAGDYIAAMEKLLLSYVPADPLLNQINCKTLVIWAENDKILPKNSAEILDEKLPRSSVKIVKNSGHAVLWEKSEAVNKNILNHLKQF